MRRELLESKRLFLFEPFTIPDILSLFISSFYALFFPAAWVKCPTLALS